MQCSFSVAPANNTVLNQIFYIFVLIVYYALKCFKLRNNIKQKKTFVSPLPKNKVHIMHYKKLSTYDLPTILLLENTCAFKIPKPL